jgi:hypothetical protein
MAQVPARAVHRTTQGVDRVSVRSVLSAHWGPMGIVAPSSIAGPAQRLPPI